MALALWWVRYGGLRTKSMRVRKGFISSGKRATPRLEKVRQHFFSPTALKIIFITIFLINKGMTLRIPSRSLFTLVATAQFNEYGQSGDPSRIASTVVTGIGFLGAGIIMYRRDVMYGLTTAAGVWATAAIGMAIGAGFVVLGVVSAVLIIMLQIFFHLPIKAFSTTHLSVIKMQVWLENDDILNKIIEELGSPRISSYKVKSVEDKLIANVEVTTKNPFSVEIMNGLIKSYPDHLLSIERNDD